MSEKRKRKNKFIDISKRKTEKSEKIDFLLYKKNKKYLKSILFSKGKTSNSFFSEDSKLYISPRQEKNIKAGMALDGGIKKWDALSARIVRNYSLHRKSQNGFLLEKFQEKLECFQKEIQAASRSYFGQFSLLRIWNLSIIGAMLFGMLSMTFVYRFLGQSAVAEVALNNNANNINNERMLAASPSDKLVLGSEIIKDDSSEGSLIINKEEAENIKDLAEMDSEIFREKAQDLVKGYPIEKMLPYILEKDRKVAAFLIGIAKKESAWGVHVPVLDGQDCYNYWGYRGQRKLMGTGGHTCFDSRKDAVDTVAKRIATLVNEKGKDTPEKMILWKCGGGCVGAPEEKKWISDVDMYFKKLDS
jgi:hypothetical protein